MGAIVDVSGNGEDQSAVWKHLPDQPRRRLSRPVIIHAHKAKAFAVRCVGVEGHHRNALLVELVDAPDQIGSIACGNGKAACPPGYQLVDLPENFCGVPALDLPQFNFQTGDL